MKIKLTIILLLFALTITCLAQPGTNKVEIDIYTPKAEYDSLYYLLSKNSFKANTLWGFTSVQFDTLGNTKLYLESDGINWLLIHFEKGVKGRWIMDHRVHLLIRPGEKYTIRFNPEKNPYFNIEGNGAEGQQLYTKLHYENDLVWKNRSDTVPEHILSALNDSIEIALEPFQELYNNGKIDSEFYKYVKTEIEYTYAYSLISSLRGRNLTAEAKKLLKNKKFAKFQKERRIVPISIKKPEYYNLISSLIEKYPIENRYAGFVEMYDKYILDSYLWYQSLTDSFEFRHPIYISDKLVNIEYAREYLSDEMHEFYFAANFGYASFSAIGSMYSLYTEFIKHYPNSIYLKGVKRSVKNFGGYYERMYLQEEPKKYTEKQDAQITSKALLPEVTFVEQKDTIASIDSLLAKFNGKPVFVDIWASWCMPCRYEFQFADTLNDFLSKNGYEMLYISVDKSEEKWMNTLTNNGLKGHHFRAISEELRNEIRELAPFVPTYMIVDENGKIVIDDAKKPHETDDLFEQLLEIKTKNIEGR